MGVFFNKNSKKSTEFTLPDPPENTKTYTPPQKVSKNISENEDIISKIFFSDLNRDIIIRKFMTFFGKDAFIAHIDGMSNGTKIMEGILEPLTTQYFEAKTHKIQNLLRVEQLKNTDGIQDAVSAILSGDTAVFVDGSEDCYLCETKGFAQRSVESPRTEGSIKGSQESFNEAVRTNITLVRKILKDPKLINEFISVGDITRVNCGVMYLQGIANPALVEEVKRRLQNIKGDFIFGSGMVEQLIEDRPSLIFPNILSTERPDMTAAHISGGSVAILCDGAPFALIAPVTIADMFHITEDTALRHQYGTLLRIIRTFALLVSIFLPSVYISLVNFHRELIPTNLLISIAEASSNLPLPSVVELLFVEMAFELIREASTRVPGLLGGSVGIVGGLILGSAAVDANLISPVLIIIIALTGLGSYAMPEFSLSLAIRIVRMALIVLSAVLGFVGISIGCLLVLTHLVTAKSFGVNILSPTAPKTHGFPYMTYKKPVYKYEFRKDYLNSPKKRNQPNISRKWDN